MTSNFRIAYPNINLNATSITVSPVQAGYTQLPEYRIAAGPRAYGFELLSAISQAASFSYSCTSTIAGADFFGIPRAKTLQANCVSSVVVHASDQFPTLPTLTTGCVLWMDAERNVVANSDGGVTSWVDRSAAVIGSQGTDANRPTLSRADNRENWCLQSEDFLNGSYWGVGRVSVSANQVANPLDQATTADKITEDTATNTHIVNQNISNFINGQTYRFSIYLRQNGRYQLVFSARGSAFPTTEVQVDLNALTISTVSGSPLNATITRMYTGATTAALSWYRVSFEVVATSTNSGTIQLGLTDNAGNQNYAGDGTSGCYAWGAQINRVSTSSSYVSATTRAQYAGVGGRRSLWFRVGDYLDLGSVPSWCSGNFTSFCVVNSHKGGSSSEGAIVGTFTPATSGFYHGVNSGGTNVIETTAGTVGGATVLSDNATHLLVARASGSSISIRTDKAADGSGSAAHTAGALYRIGYSNASMQAFRGSICEIIIYNRALSVNERANIEDYLYSKWIVSTDESRNNTFYSSTLYGPRSEDYLSSITGTTSHNNWAVTMTADPAPNASTSKYKHAKQFLCTSFDFGRDPIYTDITESKRADNVGARDAAYQISLRWEGITNAKVSSFLSSIAQYKDSITVMLHETTDQVLRGWKCVHAKLQDYSIDTIAPNNNTVNAVFQEQI